ncbi:MAG: PEP-CTERM sorting domain-containing protein [Phycisphaerales bacterium JB063]
MLRTARPIAICALLALSVGAPAQAETVSFTVDPNQSSLSINGISFIGISEAQGAGAWTTSYSGNIDVDLTDTTIAFLNTSVITAGNSGDWLPGDDYTDYDPTMGATGSVYETVPVGANYGTSTQITAFPGDDRIVQTATRDIQIMLTSDARSIIGGVFAEDGIVPEYLSGTVYYNEGAEPPITNLAGGGITVTPFADLAEAGTLVQTGDLLTLTIPVEFTTSFFVSQVTYSGTIVATATVPEPGSTALLLAGLPLLMRRRRNR